MIAAAIYWLVSIFSIITVWLLFTGPLFQVLDKIVELTDIGFVVWFLGTAIKTGWHVLWVIAALIITWYLFIKSQDKEVVVSYQGYKGYL